MPKLETDADVTESGAGLTDTAEPAAAGEGVSTEKVCGKLENFNNTVISVNRCLPSTDCVACIEVKPFCKTNNES